MSGDYPDDCPRCHGVPLLCDDLCPYEDEEAPLAVAVLGLVGDALLAARQLYELFPDVEFTSGRRTVRAQAHAMAENIAADATFITKTYHQPLCLAARRCQTWFEQNSGAKVDQIATAFERILCSLSDDELAKLTVHPTGRAIDVRPGIQAVKEAMQVLAMKYGGKFLDHEGKLDRWHLEFKK